MRNIPLLYRVLLLVGTIVASPCYAEQEDSNQDLSGEYIEDTPWQDEAFVIPPYPKAEDLIKVEVDRVDMPFNFYLDPKSLKVLKEVGVIRYTIVIESDSGAKNVMYEGLRCQIAEFRTYAYGTYDKKLVKARTSEWRHIRENGGMAHRSNFFSHYMCNQYRAPNPVETVIQKVKYPDDFESIEDRGD